MFTSVYSETCNTKVHQVLQVAANGVSDIVFAQCKIHEAHQPTVTDLKNTTMYIMLVQCNIGNNLINSEEYSGIFDE